MSWGEILAGYKSALRKILDSRGMKFAIIVSILVEIVGMIGMTFWQIIASRRIGIPDTLLPIFPMARSMLSIILFFTVISHIKQTKLKWPLYGGFFSAIVGYILLISITDNGIWKYVILAISLIFEALGIAVLHTLRESLVAIHADATERSGIMALLQTTVMLVSVPFGYIGGLLSDISRILPFVLSITLLLSGILATSMFYRQSTVHRDLKALEGMGHKWVVGTVINLTPSESKRLIAKGVTALPCIQNALKNHTIILAGGTTNGFLAEELLGETIEKKSTYTVGIVAEGKTGVSCEEDRIPPYVITKGKARERDFHWKSYLSEMEPGDVFIKGGNAVDHTGLAAVLASDNMGGTIGAAWGPVMQRGIKLVVPIGLEKLVPDVREAVEFMAGHPINEAIGDKAALMPMLGATVVTEITALETLYNVKAKCIASGGVAGTEGAVVLVMDGEEKDVKRAFEEIISLKDEPRVR